MGITLGDVAGIGPEIVIKSLARLRKEAFDLTIIGSASILHATGMMVEERFPLPAVVDTGEVDFEFGKAARSSGEAALFAIKKAIELLKEGKIDALVTAPVSKEAIKLCDPFFTGHTELLAGAFGSRDVLMVAHSPYASFAFVTTHLPLRDVPGVLSTEGILSKIELYLDFLGNLHGRKASIAVLSLNPHGKEFAHGEEDIIEQAVSAASKRGLDVRGACPADTFHLHLEEVDGFLCQYHDQGMIPAKLLARGEGVNVTWGLPFVRTSPLHGTAFDIAGKEKADPRSMIAAIRMASKLASGRN